jgi:ribonuclease HI
MEIKIYSDGACSGNPGSGGCACILLYKEHRKEFAESYVHTTNNRMELRAVILGLSNLKAKDKKVIIYSDSTYVVNSINKGWVFDWEKKKFHNRTNSDLWIEFLKLYREFKEIEMVWVKGHNGDEENENCDVLATSIIKNSSISKKEDVGYVEKSKT